MRNDRFAQTTTDRYLCGAARYRLELQAPRGLSPEAVTTVVGHDLFAGDVPLAGLIRQAAPVEDPAPDGAASTSTWAVDLERINCEEDYHACRRGYPDGHDGTERSAIAQLVAELDEVIAENPAAAARDYRVVERAQLPF